MKTIYYVVEYLRCAAVGYASADFQWEFVCKGSKERMMKKSKSAKKKGWFTRVRKIKI